MHWKQLFNHSMLNKRGEEQCIHVPTWYRATVDAWMLLLNQWSTNYSLKVIFLMLSPCTCLYLKKLDLTDTISLFMQVPLVLDLPLLKWIGFLFKDGVVSSKLKDSLVSAQGWSGLQYEATIVIWSRFCWICVGLYETDLSPIDVT